MPRAARRGLGRPLGRLGRLPGARLRGGARDRGGAEHVRVAPDHLGGDACGHRVEVEPPGLLRHLRVVDHLQQQVAELALELVQVAPRDRVRDLVGLLDRVGRDGREALLEVPRAAAVRIAQPRHHPQQALDRRGPLLGGSRRAGARRPRSQQAPCARGLDSPAARRAGRGATIVRTRPSLNSSSSRLARRALSASRTSAACSSRTSAKPRCEHALVADAGEPAAKRLEPLAPPRAGAAPRRGSGARRGRRAPAPWRSSRSSQLVQRQARRRGARAGGRDRAGSRAAGRPADRPGRQAQTACPATAAPASAGARRAPGRAARSARAGPPRAWGRRSARSSKRWLAWPSSACGSGRPAAEPLDPLPELAQLALQAVEQPPVELAQSLRRARCAPAPRARPRPSGVGARWSAAWSISVVSVSWPTAEIKRDRARRRGAHHDLLVERPQVLERAAAARDDQDVRPRHRPARRQAVEARDRGRDLLGRELALHQHRPQQHPAREALGEPVQDVLDHRPGRRGHDADHLRQERQGPLALGREQPLGREPARAAPRAAPSARRRPRAPAGRRSAGSASGSDRS